VKTIVGETLTFGRDGNASIAQLQGWSGAEDGFTWTLGSESSLLLTRPDAPFGFFIELTVHPLIEKPAPASQRIQLLLNQRPICSSTLDHGGVFTFLVDGASNGDGLLELVIRHPDVVRRAPAGRDLALAFRSVRILCLTEPLRAPEHRTSAAPLPAGSPIAAVETLLGISINDLILSFETIAGNCEFGGLQRLCGSDPLSLLRFAGASVAASIAGLDTDFAGIGENIEPRIAANALKEWMIFDRRYKLNYHTMVSSDDVPAERIVAMEKRKVHFLRRKFLEDLADAPKIFVCSDRFSIAAEEAVALFLALRRHGPAWMLWVQVATDSEQAGKVEQIFPGLMCGYIDRLAPQSDGTNISLTGWLSILANAWRLRRLEQVA
jgi:hypothetical protein